MMDFFGWLPWIGGLGGISFAACAIFAPQVIQVAATYLTALAPLIKGAADFVVWFFRDILWEGFKDMADNAASMIFVAVVAAAAVWYFHTSCETCLKEIRANYRLVPKATTVKPVTKPDVKNWSIKDYFPF